MYRSGELPGFRLGKLIRIPANEVERYECQITPSLDTVENGPSPIETKAERADASRLARLTNAKPSLSGARYGNDSPQREANG
ncbi:hypothetical protein GCM10022600_09920 [Qipengyuania pelagi]